MPVPGRHGARAWFVPVSVQRSAGAGTHPQSSLLRAVLEELDRSGTGSLEFWQRV